MILQSWSKKIVKIDQQVIFQRGIHVQPLYMVQKRSQYLEKMLNLIVFSSKHDWYLRKFIIS